MIDFHVIWLKSSKLSNFRLLLPLFDFLHSFSSLRYCKASPKPIKAYPEMRTNESCKRYDDLGIIRLNVEHETKS